MRRYHDGAVFGMFAIYRAKTLHKRHTHAHPKKAASFAPLTAAGLNPRKAETPGECSR